MTTQMQHAVRMQMMVDQFMQDNKARGYNTQLQRFLEQDCGYHVLGGGYFSIVVKHPENPDLVIKVNVGCGEGEEGFGRGPLGDGYMDYVAACMRAPKSKHLPEFHAAVVGKRTAVVIMRRYRSYNEFELPYHHRSEASDVIGWFNGHGPAHDAGVLFVLDVMGPASDLHSQNYMWDADNQCVVITDPYKYRAPGPRDRVERYLDNGKVVVDVQMQPELMPMITDMPIGARAVHDPIAFCHMMFAADMAKIERRVINQFLHADPGPLMVHKLRREVEEVNDARTQVVADRQEPCLREQEKDHVLFLRAKYDRPAQPLRVQGVLLPRQDARGIRTARTIKYGAVGREAGGIILDTRGALEWPPERLHVQNTGTKHDVAA